MTHSRAPRALSALGALLVLYLGFPVVAFLVRAIEGGDEGWHDSGLFSALWVSVEGATISLLIGVVFGIPLAYLLARRRGRLAALVGVLVQLPLAVPPLISGILLVYVVGPYTFLGQRSGERLTQTMYGVIIAMTFVSIPFLIVAARSAFRAVDPALADVAATLGHGPLSRFTRVEIPAAGDGIRAGMVLMWLRAFGEYGTVVVLAYHPFTLPVYVENLFSSAPLSEAVAPTLLAFAVAVIAIAAAGLRRPRRRRHARLPAPVAPAPQPARPVGFALDTAVGSFSLRVTHRAGSHRLAVLGPSGSGKSQALRAIAGLLGPRAGAVTLAGLDITAAAPERRRVGYVPQGYGLMPSRTVWQQVTFGVGADPAVAAWWLAALRLDGLEDRLPDELSGGQRQRVSLARALAISPEVVLLDEPFSALDAPVRAELRREVRRLQTQAGLSTVLVTHDPVEAATLADEVLVLSGGRVLQAGPCREVYRRPASVEVGRLLGIENLFEEPGWLWQVSPEAVSVSAAAAPEGRHGEPPAPGLIDLGRGVVTDVIDLGRSVETVVALADGRELRARSTDDPGLPVGTSCRTLAPADAISRWSPAASVSDSDAPEKSSSKPDPPFNDF